MSAPRITLSAQDREILAMTLAGEIDPRRSPYDDPQTLEEMANILAVAVNRYSTGAPAGFGPAYRSRPDGTRTTERMTDYNSIADVALQAPSVNSRNREFGQFSAFNPSHVRTTQANYNARPEYFQNVVDQFFSGQLQASIPDATHYHADWMTAWWADDFDKVGTSGAHHFYSDVRDMQRPLGGTRPAYAQLEFNQPAETDQPNPQGDLNQQELANIAPPLPATPAQMDAAQTPNVPQPTARPDWIGGLPTVAQPPAPDMSARTIGEYLANQPGFSVKPGATMEGLSPATQAMLDLMANSTGTGFTVTEGRRPENATYGAPNSLHKSGNALDVRRRDQTPEQQLGLLNAALAGGAREVIFYPERAGGHVHFGTRPNGRFSVSGPIPEYARQSDIFNRLQAGEQPRISTMVPGPNAPQTSFRQGDGSLDAVPGITPRPDPRDMTLPVAMPQPSRESMVQNYGQRALQASPASSPQISPNRATPQTAAFSSMQGGDYQAQQAASGGSSANTTARINQGFNDALAPRSMPSAIARVSPQGSFGTSSPQRSPDQFQYATRPTPAPSTRTETRTREVANPAYAAWESTYRGSQQKSPTDFQYAPQGPSMSAMAANYGARALQGADPFASAPPRTITERYQVSVPNPVARPNMAAPTPRGPQFAGVPNPMARPSSLPQRRSGLEQAFAGFNDWIGDRLPTMGGAAIGGALGGPLGALAGGLGGYAAQQVMTNQSESGGFGLPSITIPGSANPQHPNYGKTSWNDPIFGVSRTVGQGDSAHDAFYDSQYGGGGFAW